MTELHPDPVGDAGHKAAQLAQILIMAAEAAVIISAARTRAAAERDEQAARAISTELAVNHKAASDLWAPVLADHRRDRLDVSQTLAAWSAAQAWRSTDTSADRASDRAEEQLHALRPSAMTRYDDLRKQGLDPVEAMRQVVPLLEHNARIGQAGPHRGALTGVARADLSKSTAPAVAHNGRPVRDQLEVVEDSHAWPGHPGWEGGNVTARSSPSGLSSARSRSAVQGLRASFPHLQVAPTREVGSSAVTSRPSAPRALSRPATASAAQRP